MVNLLKKLIFLGIKQYGYQYTDVSGNIIERSTFAGVPKDTLSFDEIKLIHNNEIVIKKVPLRFYKSFKDLTISIKHNLPMELSRSNDKILINNIYYPRKINNIKYTSPIFRMLNKTIKFINK